MHGEAMIFLLAACSDSALKTFNDPPYATITSHWEGDSVEEGYPVLFEAALGDSNHGKNELEARWLVDGGEQCPYVLSDEEGYTSCELRLQVDGTVTVQVRDPANAIDEASLDITVHPTEPPSAAIESPLPTDKLYSGELIQFSGAVSDPEDGPGELEVWWESSIQGRLEMESAPDENGSLLSFSTLEEGEHGLSLHVLDLSQKEASDSVIVTVGPPNSPPECEILSPASGDSFTHGETIVFEGMVSDADIVPDQLQAEWSSDKDGPLGGSIPDSAGSVLFGTGGISSDFHTITLSVLDELGASCSRNILIEISGPPSIEIHSPADGETVNEGEVIGFSATVTDSEDDPTDLLVDWSSSLDGDLGAPLPDSSGNLAFNTSPSVGSHSLTLTAVDTEGQLSIKSQTLTVNGLPTAPTVSIVPPAPLSGEDLLASASGSTDPEGQPITYSYQWLKNGLPSGNTGMFVSSADTLKGESWTVVATPGDGFGEGPPAEATVGISNSPPEISQLAIQPALVYASTEVECSATVSDPDPSDVIVELYTWTGPAGQLLGGQPTLPLGPGIVQPGDQLICTLETGDGDGGAASASVSATVQNSIPQIDDLQLSPDPAFTDTDIEATALASDGDLHSISLSYSWTVNGSSVLNNSQSLSSLHFEKGDTVAVSVTPSDGMDSGATATESLSISNAPPTIPSVQIIPESPLEGVDGLYCEIGEEAVDPDGDGIVYSFAWSVDEVPFTGAESTAHSGDTVPGVETYRHEEWTCSLVAGDGTEDSPEATDSVEIVSSCSSLALDGDNDGISIGDGQNLLEIENAFTIHAWIWLDAEWEDEAMSILDAETTSDSLSGGGNSGYALQIREGRLALHVGTGTQTEAHWTAENPIPTNQWVQVVGIRDGSQLQLWLNSAIEHEESGLPSDDISYEGGSLEHDRYQIGLSNPQGLGGVQQEFKGMIRDLGIWSRALDSTELSQLSFQSFDESIPDLVAYWPMDEGAGTSLEEEMGSQDGTAVGDPSWVDSCPFADDDGDGYPSWTDCNDDDASAQYSDGSSESCATISCKLIHFGGYSTGDGFYWLDPDNTGSYEAYCDMTDDGGGWTLVMKAVGGNFDYEDSIWTTDTLTGENDFDFAVVGLSKYDSFNSVPFTEVRSSNPQLFSDSHTHSFSTTYTSALELFSGSSIDVSRGMISYFNSGSDPENQHWGCSDHQAYGFNQMQYLGLDDLADGAACDQNGGARWGQRVNATHAGAGNHTGQGWGAYSTICTPYSSSGSDDPLCSTGLFAIRQLLWVR
jgi:hypothetical protein